MLIWLIDWLIVQLTVNPLKETELILYGGEFYNGNKVRVVILLNPNILILIKAISFVKLIDRLYQNNLQLFLDIFLDLLNYFYKFFNISDFWLRLT